MTENHNGCGNAECCKACRDKRLPYPFMCTGSERGGNCTPVAEWHVHFEDYPTGDA